MSETRQPTTYAHRSVPMEGRLSFEWGYDGHFQFPVATARTETGITALYALHSTLEALDGRRVRVTVEWDDEPAPAALAREGSED